MLYAVPKSFYEKLFPNNYIDVFLCLTTIHWLDKNDPAPYDKFLEEYCHNSVYEVDYYSNQGIDYKT